jgi:hypothetical protein
MDQKSIVLYLAWKRFILLTISRDLKDTFYRKTMSYQFVTCYLREARYVSLNRHTTISEPESQLNDSDNIIFLALAEQSFTSIQQLVRLTNLSKIMIRRRLTQSLAFQVRHL